MTFHITAVGFCIFWTGLGTIVNASQVFTEKGTGWRLAHLLTAVVLAIATVYAL